MKKTFQTILMMTMLLVVVGAIVLPHVSFAEIAFIENIKESAINTILAHISNRFLEFTSLLVTISGIFLSISMNITTHLGDFFNNIPALKEVWLVVRNISSIVIIFALLYTSILKILDLDKASLGTIIKNIVIAGLFINFSLFFAKTLIDASNIVSLQFYRAIAPQYQDVGLNPASKAYYDGGLSDVFMSSLKLPKIYENSGFFKSADVGASIFIYTLLGSIMMVTAAISFFAAAIAFTARTGILLFVLALSPMFFASMIFPKLKDKYADKFFGIFKNQLIFMPVYLFLMYIALKFISSPGFTSVFNMDAQGLTQGGDVTKLVFVGIIVQYTIALIFINAPLFVALAFGAKGASWAPGSKNVYGVATGVGSFFGQHTFGRGAKRLSESLASSRLAVKNPNLAVLTNKSLGKISGSAFGGSKGGYDNRFKSYAEDRSKFGKGIGLTDVEGRVANNRALESMNIWRNETRDLQKELFNVEKNFKNAEKMGDSMGVDKYKNEANEIRQELKKRKKVKSGDKLNEFVKSSKEEIVKSKQKAFASNLTNGGSTKVRKYIGQGWITSEASKKAAKDILKEKSKGEQAIGLLQQELKGDSKE